MRDRDLDTTRPILCVLDGAKALVAAVSAVFDHPVMHRCQLHKIRDVKSKLPKVLGSTVAKKMRAGYHDTDALARGQPRSPGSQPGRGPSRSAGSRREGLF